MMIKTRIRPVVQAEVCGLVDLLNKTKVVRVWPHAEACSTFATRQCTQCAAMCGNRQPASHTRQHVARGSQDGNGRSAL